MGQIYQREKELRENNSRGEKWNYFREGMKK